MAVINTYILIHGVHSVSWAHKILYHKLHQIDWISLVRCTHGLPGICSVGGFTVLSTAAAYPDLVSGLVLLNASGQFENSDPTKKLGDETPQKDVVELQESLLRRHLITPIKNAVQRYSILFAFWQAKQPARVKSVLQNVSLPAFSALLVILTWVIYQFLVYYLLATCRSACLCTSSRRYNLCHFEGIFCTWFKSCVCKVNLSLVRSC
jgi:hypothetical protein